MSEWVEWHRRYDAEPGLARRLEVVREKVRGCLAACAPGPIRVISVCAGDGRDLLGALAGHPRQGDVSARLVEVDPELVARARARVAMLGTPDVEVCQGDASSTDAYAGATPADLILICGVFGNVSDDDVHRTVARLPELCAPAATVVWTRGRFEPDLTPAIRGWFVEAGFAELAFLPIPESSAAVGAHQLTVSPRPFVAGTRLFTFLPKERRPADIARRRG